MKIFVSWSGKISHDAAQELKRWLPNVIQAITEDQVFLSSHDIGKGAQWFSALSEVLEDSNFAILCLTPKNKDTPWMLYEAGAVAKRLGEARVVPLLIGLEPRELTDPLAQFNATQVTKEEVKRLVSAINERLGDDRLTEKKLNDAFGAWWPQLEPKLKAAVTASHQHDYTYDVFLSTPMAAFANDAEYRASRKQIMKVFDALKDGGERVYWAAERIESMEDFDTLDVSASDDIAALEQSRCFVLIYPEKLVSSALLEAGYALALKRPSHYFVEDRDDLPFLMRELAGPVQNVRIHTKADWKDYDDLARKICKNKDKWF